MLSKLISTVALGLACVSAHAGIRDPPARDPLCVDFDTCGLVEAPCGGLDPTEPTIVLGSSIYDVQLYQEVAHASEENTYTFNWVPTEGEPIPLAFQTQNDTTEQGLITFPVLMPPEGTGYLQMVFDATPGGGDVYYSCADIILEPAIATQTVVETGSETFTDFPTASVVETDSQTVSQIPTDTVVVTDTETIGDTEEPFPSWNPTSSSATTELTLFGLSLVVIAFLF